MPSSSLVALILGLAEVRDLLAADPTQPGRISTQPTTSRVIGRAAVVLLSSHFERYVHSANDEAVAIVNAGAPAGSVLPLPLRLQHSRAAVETLAATAWTNRGPHLEALVLNEAWLWGSGGQGSLAADQLIDWMTTPLPKELVRYYGLWGVRDVFSSITRTSHTRSDLWLRLEELVRKRNAIAHGDATSEATKADVMAYLRASMTFCTRADRLLATQLAALLGTVVPW